MPDIEITSLEGQKFNAYCASPAGDTGPGMIVIQEIFGVNANMRAICDAYAERGYLAICPDLFWRQEPAVQLDSTQKGDVDHALVLHKGFDVEAGVRDLLSTVAHIRRMASCSGKIGVVGYCLGGKLAYLMATRADLDAMVGFYGVDLEKYLSEVHDIRTPLMLHIAALDSHTPLPVREKMLKSFKRNPVIEAYIYEGVDHAFARVGGANYNKEAADLSNQRTADFFTKHLMT